MYYWTDRTTGATGATRPPYPMNFVPHVGWQASAYRPEDVYTDHLVESRIAPEWRYAEGLLARLGAFGDYYVTVSIAGGRFPRIQPRTITMRRGPILPGVDEEHVASLGRELMRAVGSFVPES